MASYHEEEVKLQAVKDEFFDMSDEDINQNHSEEDADYDIKSSEESSESDYYPPQKIHKSNMCSKFYFIILCLIL